MRLCAVLLCVILISEKRRTFTDGYAICGKPSHKAVEVNNAVDAIIKQLMDFRAPDWGWASISTITSIQVAAPKKLFARDKVTKLITDIIKYDWDYMNILELGELAFAAKSLCMNPRKIGGHDLLEEIHDGMYEFLVNTSSVQPDHVVEYSLGLASLCINQYPIEAHLVNELLRAQNPDGSFGTDQIAMEATIFMVRPAFCLTKLKNPLYDVTKVQDALKKMRQYTKKHVIKTKTGVYIGGDEIMSNDALIGLYKSMEPGEDPDKDWSCSAVSDTLGLSPKPGEDEYDLTERLMRITATDFLDLLPDDYKCVPTDPIPPGYTPTCDYEKPETCGMTEEGPK